MSSPHKRKRIVLKLTPEQASDPQSILDATRDALKRQARLTLVICDKAGEPPTSLPPVPAPPDGGRLNIDELAQTAIDHATAILRKKTGELNEAAEKPKLDLSKWYDRLTALREFIEKNKEFLIAVYDRVAKSLGVG